VFGQVRAQGEDSTEDRNICGHVPLDHVPELMCALGYHPTQADITDMISSLAYSAATAGDGRRIDVDLSTFCSLFYNFRPVHGVRHLRFKHNDHLIVAWISI
jgi:cilia- and flagella-associated protein 251